MKVVIAFLALAVVAVMSEQCRENHDCTDHGITMCGNGYHVVCHNHQCECTTGPGDQTCMALSDCTNDCGNRHKHCVDGHCTCTRF